MAFCWPRHIHALRTPITPLLQDSSTPVCFSLLGFAVFFEIEVEQRREKP
jgi:hypothetical protein